ncbi:AsmA-like C-terminal region-containing protein [Parvularcula sp. LCG005]|uniref:YhdP family protein n=1 Tax=Parvularcula sp. LCG005 TaxID=3078805 RepID=UPI0029438DC9|nr:AsmA-like C-terminal region-containing protein [Parvularcula sp. LCG005]WOI54112.1 AsmA-like C-terminal region-containing protein [Parvularcula sp. LCG005]
MTGRPMSKTRAFRVACGHCGRWTLRGAAFGAAILSTLVIFLFSMLGVDGVSLGMARPSVERLLAERLNADDVQVGTIRLLRDRRGDAPFRLTINDIHVDRRDGSGIDIPGLAIQLDGGDFFRGRTMPRFIEVRGADISVERRSGSVAVAGQDDDGQSFDIADIISTARQNGFEGALLTDLDLAYTNTETGASFHAKAGEARLIAGPEGYAFGMVVSYSGSERQALILDIQANDKTGEISATLAADGAPAGSILPLFIGEGTDISLDADISGTMTATGTLTDGFTMMGVSLHTAQGKLKVLRQEVPVGHMTLDSTFDPVRQRLEVSSLSYDIAENAGELAGVLDLAFVDGVFRRLEFDLAATDLVLDPGQFLPQALPIVSASTRGALDLGTNELRFDQIDAAYFGARIAGKMSYLLPETAGQAPGLKADLAIEGVVSPSEVLRGWPTGAARDARGWIDENLPAADLFNVVYHMDIPRGVIEPTGGLPDEYLDLTFDARNATVIYVPGMTPIKRLKAKGHLRGNSFALDVSSGRVKDINVVGGKVRMDRFVPKGDEASFSVRLAGPLRSMLALLDEPPLGYMTAAELDPALFEGDAAFNLTVTRPMLSEVPEEDYGFSGTGSFSNVSIESIGPGIPVSNGQGTVTLTDQALVIKGSGESEGTPATFEVSRQLGGAQSLRLVVDAALDATAADAIGLPLRRFVRGTAPSHLVATGGADGFDRLEVRSDLSATTIATDDDNIVKARGEPGDAFFAMTFGEEGDPLNLETIRLSMARANVEGNARLTEDGGLISLELPRLFIEGAADLSLRLGREAGLLSISVDGEYADLSPLVDAMMNRDGDSAPLPGAIAFDGNLAQVDLNGGVRVRDVSFTGRHDGLGMRSGKAVGTFATGGTLSIDVSANPYGIGKDIRVVTDQFGKLLNGLFGISTLSGGDAMLTATAIDNGPLAGTIRATDIRMQDAPTIARLLSVGSFDGLANVLNGEGLEFDELQGDVQIEAGVLRLVDARMTGSALGLSANGEVDMARGQFGLRGAVAPAYAVNSLFGNVPGLGELFVSREGEGVFAMAYRIDGPVATPTITVNSLSALTPGIFRRVFEPAEEDAPSTDELLSAAEESAGLNEAIDFVSTPELLREYEERRKNRVVP